MSSLTRGGCARRSSTMLVHLRQRSCGHWSTQPRAVGWWAIAWAGPPERSRSWTRQGRSSRGAGSEVVPGSKVSVFLGGSKKPVTTKAPFSRCSPGCGTRQCSRRAPTRNKGMPVTLKETRACRRGPDTGGAEPAASKRAGTFAARLTYCRERLLYDFCKGGSLRNEPQYPAMGYALHSGRGGSDSEDEKRGGAFSGSFEEEEEE